jgi:triosephosphate isomerase
MGELAPAKPKVMKNIVAGNWKSNKLMPEALELMNEVQAGLDSIQNTEVIIAPPSPYLAALAENKKGALAISAQQCSATGMGAHTGEHTAEMLKSTGAEWVIIGHSERRECFGESNEAVRSKLELALEAGLHVLLCCGESLSKRESGNHFDWVQSQLEDALQNVSDQAFDQVVIAYEPIWAIGTGKTASSDQAQEMHAFIRNWLSKRYGDVSAAACRILYGGSCKPSNADELFAQPDVNGGLIGGASLNAEDFLAIVRAAEAQD